MAPNNPDFATPDQPIFEKDRSNGTESRIQPLDVLRAIALLAGLLVSIWISGGFTNNKQLHSITGPHGNSYRLYSFIQLFLQGKMLSLISLVFGAGIILYLAKANNQKELPAADLFIRRQMWLFAFGLLNALLFLWSGDVLYHLAIVGILLFPFARLSSKELFVAALITTAIFCGKNYWKYSDDKKAYNKYVAVTAVEKKISRDSALRAGKAILAKDKNTVVALAKKDSLSKLQKADKAAWEGRLATMKYDPKKDEGEYKEMRTTSFGDIWNHVLPATQNKESQWIFQSGIWDIASMMLIGMALFKLGFFNQRLSGNKYLLLTVACLGAGLLLGWYRLHFRNVGVADYTKYILHYRLPSDFFFPIEKLLMATGYASAVMCMISISWLVALWSALAAAGRLALTNYLMQSIICTLFFTGYGMGYFGKLEQHELYFVAAEIWIVQIVCSVLWLRRFEYGPAEWLWRCLTYGRWLPIKKSNTGSTAHSIETGSAVLS